jgi:hypothetical protein
VLRRGLDAIPLQVAHADCCRSQIGVSPTRRPVGCGWPIHAREHTSPAVRTSKRQITGRLAALEAGPPPLPLPRERFRAVSRVWARKPPRFGLLERAVKLALSYGLEGEPATTEERVVMDAQEAADAALVAWMHVKIGFELALSVSGVPDEDRAYLFRGYRAACSSAGVPALRLVPPAPEDPSVQARAGR